MTHKQREPDWSAWNNWCDSRIDARRSFDREVLVELVAELKALIEDQDEKMKAQADNIGALDTKLRQLASVNDLRSVEDRHTGDQLAEHQVAIAELRRLVNAEQAKVIDLPNVMQRRGLN
ncbi:hypothetical protein [Bradyrhizobium sp. 2S1]|uniref:hypothetical protein n=1 Tax=Bradyrhizobium sp. 2S1 TaxID=1404429 RepID=UPI001408FCBF|nr:hypothetical protein [Bradyrhizobium sp. 2S1]MCK7669378.1 hypothetical protein [Bradyrhizobium sp. 2S1]